jgi:hypothetical protein
MASAITTYPLPQDVAAWSLKNFGGADLGDARRDARLLRLAAAIAAAPDMTIPKQTETWDATKAAYRLLSNHDVSPDAIQTPHRQLTRRLCALHPIILCIEDTSEIDYTSRKDVKGLGKTGTGYGRGFEQHSTLAALPNGDVVGLLDMHSCLKPEPPAGETRTQAAERWNMGDLWPDAVRRVGPSPQGCRFIHVADRGGDSFKMMRACVDTGVGFLLRAKSDRYVESHSTRLWDHAERGTLAGTQLIEVSRQNAKPSGVARQTEVSVRFAKVQIDPPVRCDDPAVDAWVVLVTEVSPPQGERPIEWLLITSEPIDDASAALTAVEWYRKRWVIEDWHKALKSICGLERSQLDDAADLQRLAAILGVVAVWLLQLRDSARKAGPEADDPAELRRMVPPIWIKVVAKMTKQRAEEMTPRKFLLALAKRGGFLGRKSDGNPGWKTIYLGWSDYARMVEFAEAAAEVEQGERCG